MWNGSIRLTINMRPRVLGTLCKLLQRRAYTCLSSTYGTWCCIGGLLLLLISCVQFGEVLLEWSLNRYSQNFDTNRDEGRILNDEKDCCYPLPIDVVYTWVNGTDARLITELNKAKKVYLERCNATEAAAARSRYSWGSGTCPYPNCVAINAIAIMGLPQNMSLADIKRTKLLQVAKHLDRNVLGDPLTSVLYFPEGTSLSQIDNKTITLSSGEIVNMSRIFLTSTLEKGKQRLAKDAIIHDVPDDVVGIEIKRALGLQDMKVKSVYVYKKSSIAHVVFHSEADARGAISARRGNLTLEGSKIRFFPATLTWRPLHPPLDLNIGENEDISSSRFADNEELRYSLRSIEKFAPWVRNIYIVTNGQIPSWLDVSNERVKIVTHSELFSNQSHLPTFSSPAIETHIHKIKGLSDKFIYMNDDVFFGDYVWPDDFYTLSRGHKVYLTWPVPNCNDGCPSSWIHDKYCDKACNVSECDWDGGDCLNNSVILWQQGVLQSLAHQSYGAYCHAGCANNWVGDRYCDGNCNNADCGFDAGDCGLEQFHKLHSFTLPPESNTTLAIPDGIASFYVNLTSIFGRGEVTEASFEPVAVLRTAILSSPFSLLSVTLHRNFSQTIIPFHLFGYKDTNHSQAVNIWFNVSVNTAADVEPAKPTLFQVEINTTSEIKLSVTKQLPKTVYRKLSGELDKFFSSLDSIVKRNDSVVDRQALKLLGVQESAVMGKNNSDFLQRLLHSKEIDASMFRIFPWLDDLKDTKQMTQGIPSKAPYAQNDSRSSRKILWLNHLRADDIDRGQLLYDKLPAKVHRQMKQHGFLPWERRSTFSELEEQIKQLDIREMYSAGRFRQRHLLDTFANSLHHVGKIYNRAFGYQARKVPAHMPHFVDVNIISEMQAKFATQFDVTSSHKIRSSDDMQFAFAFQYYVMSLPATLNVTELFKEFDTDRSGVLSERELRTVAARTNALPLVADVINQFEEMIRNCSHRVNSSDRSYLPRVTREFLLHCPSLLHALNLTMKGKTKYKFEILGEDSIAFKMLRGNSSQVLQQLDWVRKHKRKFICLNDNIDHDGKEAKLLRAILKDFYESLFPTSSQFELPYKYRNRFLYVDEFAKWKQQQPADEMRTWPWLLLGVLLGCCLAVLLLNRIRMCLRHVFRGIVGTRGSHGRHYSTLRSSHVI